MPLKQINKINPQPQIVSIIACPNPKPLNKKTKKQNILMSLQAQGFASVPLFVMESQQTESISYNPMHSDYMHENKSQCVIPLTEKKSNTNSIKNQDEKSFMKNQLDLSQLSLPLNRIIEKLPIVVKANRSLFPEALNKKIENKMTEITVFYFGSARKLVFDEKQINKKFLKSYEQPSPSKQLGLIKFFIPFLVKQYCKLFLNFQPLEVNYENFQLKIAGFNGEDDPLVDCFSHEEEISWLYECGNLLLIRKQKNYDKFKVWQKNLAPDMQVLQIIIPFQREITEQVEKTKTLAALKQKLISYSQLGNIAIVTYTTFTVCEPKKKITEIAAIDRILEVYRIDVSTYEDVDTTQNREQKEVKLIEPATLQSKETRTVIDDQFEVSQNFYSGKLYIQILGTKIIEKYEGGLVGYFMANQRRYERSVHTLVGISCEKTKVKMKFLDKTGAETCVYEFQSRSKVEEFFKCIMKIGRELKQNFEKIPK